MFNITFFVSLDASESCDYEGYCLPRSDTVQSDRSLQMCYTQRRENLGFREISCSYSRACEDYVNFLTCDVI